MKQIQLKKPGGLDNILLCDADAPKPKSNQIVIKIAASSLNYHDLLVALGFIPTEDGRVPLSDALFVRNDIFYFNNLVDSKTSKINEISIIKNAII